LNANNRFDLLSKLEKDMKKIHKKIKNTINYQQKIKDNKDSMQINIENSELLDLKTELCSLKNKYLQ
jgi:hypothetical protein